MRRSISIIIPAYNEEKRLPATLRTVKAYLEATSWEFAEVVVVDDGSRDGTAELAGKAGVRVLKNPGNRGKGYSVRHGMLEAKGEWLLFSDADLSTPIEELEKLWSAVEREQAQAAIGSRDLDRSLIGVRQPLFREFGGRFFNLVIRLITGARNFPASAGGALWIRRGGALHRAAAGVSHVGSAGPMERRGGHQSEDVGRADGVSGSSEGPLERHRREV